MHKTNLKELSLLRHKRRFLAILSSEEMNNCLSDDRPVDREKFLRLLGEQFPKIHAELDPDYLDLIHLVMADVARETSEAIRKQDWDQVRSHFAFMERVLVVADSDVKNAIIVSYLENILLFEEGADHLHAKSLLPRNLKKSFAELVAHFQRLANLEAGRPKVSG